jgi:DNA-binding response OmpR family regulator
VEFEIFSILLQNKNRTITREKLTEALSSVSSHRTLDYHIKNIRTKIEKDSKNPKYLKTEYGIGYKLIF